MSEPTNQIEVGYGYMPWHHDPQDSDYQDTNGNWYMCVGKLPPSSDHSNRPHRKRISQSPGFEIVPLAEVHQFIRTDTLLTYPVPRWSAFIDSRWTYECEWSWSDWNAGIIRAFQRPASKREYDSRTESAPQPGDGWELVPEAEVRSHENEIASTTHWEAWIAGRWLSVWTWPEWHDDAILAFRRPIPDAHVGAPVQPDPRKEWVPRSVRMPTIEDALTCNGHRLVTWLDADGIQSTLFDCDGTWNWLSSQWTHWRTPFDPPVPELKAWEKELAEHEIDWLAGARWARDNPELAKEMPE